MQASWAWTHDKEDAHLYTSRGCFHLGKWDDLAVARILDEARESARTGQAVRLND